MEWSKVEWSEVEGEESVVKVYKGNLVELSRGTWNGVKTKFKEDK